MCISNNIKNIETTGSKNNDNNGSCINTNNNTERLLALRKRQLIYYLFTSKD